MILSQSCQNPLYPRKTIDLMTSNGGGVTQKKFRGFPMRWVWGTSVFKKGGIRMRHEYVGAFLVSDYEGLGLGCLLNFVSWKDVKRSVH